MISAYLVIFSPLQIVLTFHKDSKQLTPSFVESH